MCFVLYSSVFILHYYYYYFFFFFVVLITRKNVTVQNPHAHARTSTTCTRTIHADIILALLKCPKRTKWNFKKKRTSFIAHLGACVRRVQFICIPKLTCAYNRRRSGELIVQFVRCVCAHDVLCKIRTRSPRLRYGRTGWWLEWGGGRGKGSPLFIFLYFNPR
jgi:hypothetical protein